MPKKKEGYKVISRVKVTEAMYAYIRVKADTEGNVTTVLNELLHNAYMYYKQQEKIKSIALILDDSILVSKHNFANCNFDANLDQKEDKRLKHILQKKYRHYDD